MATQAEIQTAYKALYRADLNAAVAKAIADTGISVDAYVARELPNIASTTQAAVAIASFITGTAPTSAKLDELKVEADKQVKSYTDLGVANPALGAFEAFGRSFATDTTTTAGFNTKYGALSTTDFINLVYAQVYGTTPTAGALANLTAQVTSFTALYTANNVPNASLAAKGAVLGQIVGYAFTSSASANSTLDNQVASLLTAAANGDTSVYNKALPTVVEPGQVGVTITLTSATDTVSTTQANPALKSTGFNDTINATAGVGLATGVKIDGAGGEDVLNVKLTANYSAGTGEITGIESINLTGASANWLDFADKVTGVKSVGFNNVTTDTAEFRGLLAGTTLSVIDTDTAANTSKNVVFAFKAADVAGSSDTASLTVNGLDDAAKTVTVQGIETLNLSAVTANSTFTLVDAALKTLNAAASKDVAVNLAASVALETVNATGAGKVTLTNLANTVKTIDGSANTGGVVAATVGNEAITLKGGSGADQFGGITKTGAVVTTGGGNDIVTFTLGANTDTATVTGGQGADNITLGANGKINVIYTAQTDSTNANFDTITNFTSGGASADKLDFKGLALAGDKTALNAFNAAAALADGTDYFAGKAVAYGNFAGGEYFVLADINNNGKFDINADLIIKVNNGLGGVVIGDFIFS